MRPLSRSALLGPVALVAFATVVAVTLGACSGLRSGKAFLEVRPPVAFEMLRDNPTMAILDVRTHEEYVGPVGHLTGATNIPLARLGDRLTEIAVLKEQTFLVYCGHDACGQEAVATLRANGFDEVVLMDGGIDGWIVAGFGTVTGPSPPVEFGTGGETEISVE